MSVERLRNIVQLAVSALFEQIRGGRIVCESEPTLQLHLGRIVTTVADLNIVTARETFSIELEKSLRGGRERRGNIDIWFRLTTDDGREWRCAIEMKFFKKKNQREPNNRYDVFKDIKRLEGCKDVADIGFMLVATDHPHYISHAAYSRDTCDFDIRHGTIYVGGTVMTYRTQKPYGPPLTLAHDYKFSWKQATETMQVLLLEITPDQDF